jgi:hypothetical protein
MNTALNIVLLPDATSILYNAIIPGTSISGTKLDTAYLIYGNGGATQPPEIEPAQIAAFLESLQESSNQDYIRCNILTHHINTQRSEKPTLTAIIITDSNTGVNGKPFSANANSHIHTIIIAASQTNNKQDLLFALTQVTPDNQVPKPENGNLTITVDITLTQ